MKRVFISLVTAIVAIVTVGCDAVTSLTAPTSQYRSPL